MLETVSALLWLGQLLWLAFIVLLLLAAGMLLCAAKYRYAVAIAAFSCTAMGSLAWIVVVRVADGSLRGIVVEVLGAWAVFLVPHVIETTIWPLIVFAVSLACIAALLYLSRKAKRAAAS